MQQVDNNLNSIAYAEILHRIVSYKVKPGAFLQERTLADELNMSRTPIREALNRLSQEGWVQINARRNIEVKNITRRDVDALFGVRQTLELRGIDYIIDNNLTKSAYIGMEHQLDLMRKTSLNEYQYNRADIHFHRILALADGNHLFENFWEKISLENARMGIMAYYVFEKNAEKVNREHKDISEAIMKRKKKEAKSALLFHLEIVKKGILYGIGEKDGEK